MEELTSPGLSSGSKPATWTAEQRAKWQLLAPRWHEAPAPASPSQDDLRYFIAACEAQAGSGGAVALLGCTPAIRRAIRNSPLKDAQLYCIDFSPEMWEVTTEALGSSSPNEEFIESTWQELAASLPRRVDVVLGDKSLDNVAFGEWPGLFESIHHALRPKGHLIVHVGLVVRDPRPLDVGGITDGWAARLANGLVSVDDAASGLWEDLLTGSVRGPAPADPHRLSVGVFQDELLAVRQRGDLTEAHSQVLARFAELFGSSLGDAWTAFTLEELIQAASPLFAPQAAYWSADYDAALLQPILDLEAR